MKKLLIGLMLLSTFSAKAADCGVIQNLNGLSTQQKQVLVITCESEKLKAVNSNAIDKSDVVSTLLDDNTGDKLTKISEIAKIAGQTVHEVALELNVATNEFVKTPVGMGTAALAVWYVAGDKISGFAYRIWSIFFGVILIIISTLFCGVIRKSSMLKEVVVEPATIFGITYDKKVKTYYTWSEISGDDSIVPVLTVVIQTLCYIISLCWIA